MTLGCQRSSNSESFWPKLIALYVMGLLPRWSLNHIASSYSAQGQEQPAMLASRLPRSRTPRPGPGTPNGATAYQAAVINYRFLAHAVLSTAEAVVDRMS